MKIKLAEEIRGQQRNETTYDGPEITIGRNPATCKIVFDQKQWPTVSRQHAQLLFQNGGWKLLDKGSTYGTFLNGQQVNGPVPLQLHSRIQFGPDGPVLVVTGFPSEVEAAAGANTVVDFPRAGGVAQAQVVNVEAHPHVLPTTPPKHHPAASPAAVELSGTGTGQLRRLELTKEVIRFGR